MEEAKIIVPIDTVCKKNGWLALKTWVNLCRMAHTEEQDTANIMVMTAMAKTVPRTVGETALSLVASSGMSMGNVHLVIVEKKGCVSFVDFQLAIGQAMGNGHIQDDMGIVQLPYHPIGGLIMCGGGISRSHTGIESHVAGNTFKGIGHRGIKMFLSRKLGAVLGHGIASVQANGNSSVIMQGFAATSHSIAHKTV